MENFSDILILARFNDKLPINYTIKLIPWYSSFKIKLFINGHFSTYELVFDFVKESMLNDWLDEVLEIETIEEEEL